MKRLHKIFRPGKPVIIEQDGEDLTFFVRAVLISMKRNTKTNRIKRKGIQASTRAMINIKTDLL